MYTEGDMSAIRSGFRNVLSVGVSNSFLNGNLMVQLWGNDLLNQQYASYTTFDRAVISSGSNEYHTRQVVLMVRYQFNATKSRYKGQGAGSSEKQRL